MTPAPPTALVLFLIFVGMVSVYLAAWAQFHARVAGAQAFSLLMLCITLYALGYAVEISRHDLVGVLQAIRIEYLGIAFIPTTLMLFVLHYVNEKPASLLTTAALSVIPIITLVMIFTVEQHNWFYQNPRIVAAQFFPAIAFERGPWYYVNWVYVNGMPLAAVLILLNHARRAAPRKRRQIIGIALCSSIPLLSSLLYIAGLIPGHIDSGPLALGLGGMLSAVVLFKFGLFELVPAARELALDSINDAFLVLNPQEQLQDMNWAARRLFVSQGLAIGSPLPEVSPLRQALAPLLNQTRDQVEFSTGETEDTLRHYQARAYPILGRKGALNGTAILVRDITETAGLLKRLSHQANTDMLTGLLNRRQLMRLGEIETERSRNTGQPLGVILFDLDLFKEINDEHGHAAGDEVLKSVAQCFLKALRTGDFLGRYGGEEFAALLPGANLEKTTLVAERIRQNLLACTVAFEGTQLSVTASFGVTAVQPDAHTTFDDLLKSADQGLYQAKSGGRNRVCPGPAPTDSLAS